MYIHVHYNKLKIPVVSSLSISKLFSTTGSNKIYIEKFLNEYYEFIDNIIEGELNGMPVKPHIDFFGYAVEKDYDVTFKKGDIIKNDHYDPSIKEITIYDDEQGNSIKTSA